MLPRISLQAIVADKLVVVVFAPKKEFIELIANNGAAGVLSLTRLGSREPARRSGYIECRMPGALKFHKNNCQVAILNSYSSLGACQKYFFYKSNIETILIPLRFGKLLRFGGVFSNQRLKPTGVTKVAFGRSGRWYMVLEVRRKSGESPRLYVPDDVVLPKIFELIKGIDYVLLRWVENVESETGYRDVDILAADAALPILRERLSREIGTTPIEVYSESGIGGHNYAKAPYFMPEMARRMLDSKELRLSGIQVPSPLWRYLSVCYHLLLHGKSRHIPPDATRLHENTWRQPKHYLELMRLAAAAGLPAPKTFNDIERTLRDHDAFPGKDLIGFYARRNPFVTGRYVNKKRTPPGLVVFFVREFGNGKQSIRDISTKLAREFQILAEGPVTEVNRALITNKVRGGNWHDEWLGTTAEPIHWFICYDPDPVTPTAKLRRKYPHLDNERITVMKLSLREEASKWAKTPTRIVHASDNSNEALEHIEVLDAAQLPEVRKAISELTSFPTSPRRPCTGSLSSWRRRNDKRIVKSDGS